MTASALSSVTPVTLLTGFLGSGKTTLLNRILHAPGVPQTAVLINEFGAVAIDHLLVRESSDNITVMKNGCICCSVATDMVKALRELHVLRAEGKIPNFSRVIIETTGLADPAPIMHTLLEMPLIAARYALSGVITTVDATHAMQQFSSHPESVKQAAVADRIVITKTDLVDGELLDALKERLANLNPGARVFDANDGNLASDALFDTGLYQPGNKTPDVAKWLNAEAYRPRSNGHHGLLRGTSSAPLHRHDERISSTCIQYHQPLEWDDLVGAIEMLQSVRGDQLLRIKGIVNVRGETRPRVLHGVQHTLYPAPLLSAWPDEDRTTRLVFIVRDLDTNAIRDALDQFVLSDALIAH